MSKARMLGLAARMPVKNEKPREGDLPPVPTALVRANLPEYCVEKNG